MRHRHLKPTRQRVISFDKMRRREPNFEISLDKSHKVWYNKLVDMGERNLAERSKGATKEVQLLSPPPL